MKRETDQEKADFNRALSDRINMYANMHNKGVDVVIMPIERGGKEQTYHIPPSSHKVDGDRLAKAAISELNKSREQERYRESEKKSDNNKK